MFFKKSRPQLIKKQRNESMFIFLFDTNCLEFATKIIDFFGEKGYMFSFLSVDWIHDWDEGPDTDIYRNAEYARKALSSIDSYWGVTEIRIQYCREDKEEHIILRDNHLVVSNFKKSIIDIDKLCEELVMFSKQKAR